MKFKTDLLTAHEILVAAQNGIEGFQCHEFAWLREIWIGFKISGKMNAGRMKKILGFAGARWVIVYFEVKGVLPSVEKSWKQTETNFYCWHSLTSNTMFHQK